MTADVRALKVFLLDRVYCNPDLAGPLVEAIRGIVTMWPDTLGQWTADEAEAAAAMKEHVLRRLAEVWDSHPDFQPEWGPSIPRPVPGAQPDTKE